MKANGKLHAPRALGGTVTYRLHTLAKLTDRISQALYQAEAALPLGEARCLTSIGSFRPLSVNDLASRANLTKGQASRAAQSLVDQGLVRKQASASDGRGVVLTLTAKGEKRWQQTMDLVALRNAQIVACLSPAERVQFDRLLDRLLAQARSFGDSLSA